MDNPHIRSLLVVVLWITNIKSVLRFHPITSLQLYPCRDFKRIILQQQNVNDKVYLTSKMTMHMLFEIHKSNICIINHHRDMGTIPNNIFIAIYFLVRFILSLNKQNNCNMVNMIQKVLSIFYCFIIFFSVADYDFLIILFHYANMALSSLNNHFAQFQVHPIISPDIEYCATHSELLHRSRIRQLLWMRSGFRSETDRAAARVTWCTCARD